MGNMTADDFLAVRGITVESLEDLAESVLSGKGDREELAAFANTVLDVVAAMREAGVSVPPLAALVRRGRGRPSGSGAIERRDQVEACLALLKMAEVPRSIAVELVASAADLSERDAYRTLGVEILPEVSEGWSLRAYLIAVASGDNGKGVLLCLLKQEPTGNPELLTYWRHFRDFLSVT